MITHISFSNWLRRSGWVILLIALVQFILHLWANSHDNFFRDELYYMAAAQHLSAGYVEFPPFAALIAAFSRAVLGSSVLAIRLLPALAGALMVLPAASRLTLKMPGLASRHMNRIASENESSGLKSIPYIWASTSTVRCIPDFVPKRCYLCAVFTVSAAFVEDLLC